MDVFHSYSLEKYAQKHEKGNLTTVITSEKSVIL
jgi:hypothetical protein